MSCRAVANALRPGLPSPVQSSISVIESGGLHNGNVAIFDIVVTWDGNMKVVRGCQLFGPYGVPWDNIQFL
jgi:hypothetical protein